MKKKFYCVGNAHLDPAWMWCWQEGSAEAKATIRSALDRMKEFDDFKFVCSSSSVFEWIEEFDPDMFVEIKSRVKEGRFVIVGGWYVQPDCNLPSGEGFARQTLYAQRYFLEKLGVTAKIGYNVDSFGHNGMLPQILKKSGMDGYLFMRPSPREKSMESNLFYWQSPDGSKVLTFRIIDPYCFRYDKYSWLEHRLEYISGKAPAETDAVPFFYGVGNHGGGPTIRHIELIKEFAKNNPDKEMIFSNLSDFYDEMRSQTKYKIPTFTDDLQHHASGCYAAYGKVKDDIRRCEYNLMAAESFAMLTTSLLGRSFPADTLKTAWKNVNFIHFHDIAGGCCIKDAYVGETALAGEALSVAMKTENNALQTLSWAVDTSDRSKGLPVVFFNPHPFDVETYAQINRQVNCVYDGEDNEIPYQYVHSQTHLCYRRSDSVFKVKVPASGYATYYFDRDIKDTIVRRWAPEFGRMANAIGNYFKKGDVAITTRKIEDDFFRVEFDVNNGYMVSLFDKKNNREMLKVSDTVGKCRKKSVAGKYGAMPVVIEEKDHDTWSHGKNFFDVEIGAFGEAEYDVVDCGPIRATLKVRSKYKSSTLTQYFTLENDGILKVKATVDWHETQKMLKIAFPLSLTDTKALYEMPFGAIERPADGEEECGHTWIATIGAEGGVAMLNDNKYSFSVKDNVMNLTAVRSPYFGDHGAPLISDECEITDQGESNFSYAILPFTDRADITKKAKLFNKKLSYVVENNHNGTLPAQITGVTTSVPNVIVSAIKRSEDGKGTVLRAYEVNGEDVTATFDGVLLPAPLTARFTKYSVNTYYLPDGENQWTEVLMSELPL